jgi:hypothetical protein
LGFGLEGDGLTYSSVGFFVVDGFGFGFGFGFGHPFY